MNIPIFLPLYSNTKTKSIYFLNSPKLWTRNFFSYLEKNHCELYSKILTGIFILKVILITILILFVSYFTGYYFVNKIFEINEFHKKNNIIFCFILTMIGLGIFLVFLIFSNVFSVSVYFIIDSIIKIYITLLDFISVLQTYNDKEFIKNTNNEIISDV